MAVTGASSGNTVEWLHQTAPGTLMGRLLRSFWQPVATSASIEPGKARGIRILSEDLTLYRGESGTPHLVGSRCAHRGTVLHTGWVEGENIRCMYHGWRFPPAGLCDEIPAEKQPRERVAQQLVAVAVGRQRPERHERVPLEELDPGPLVPVAPMAPP